MEIKRKVPHELPQFQDKSCLPHVYAMKYTKPTKVECFIQELCKHSHYNKNKRSRKANEKDTRDSTLSLCQSLSNCIKLNNIYLTFEMLNCMNLFSLG